MLDVELLKFLQALSKSSPSLFSKAKERLKRARQLTERQASETLAEGVSRADVEGVGEASRWLNLVSTASFFPVLSVPSERVKLIGSRAWGRSLEQKRSITGMGHPSDLATSYRLNNFVVVTSPIDLSLSLDHQLRFPSSGILLSLRSSCPLSPLPLHPHLPLPSLSFVGYIEALPYEPHFLRKVEAFSLEVIESN